ncbi:MAG TPA: hypothetical protein VNJ01_04740 [Bacteriovoracaceae bacterium]|nr:hypothetical protein [Bacteriovoracaceae bacterium]
MKTILLFLLFSNLCFIGAALGAPMSPKQKRWNQLMKLVNQEMKILENTRRKGVDLHYRMLELHSEKLKLIHEKNNNEFLAKSKLPGFKGKDFYFGETRKYYQLSREFGFKILSDYPTNPRRAEVLFAMALNARDYAKDTITEKFLLEAISLVKDPHSSLRHHAQTALADFYYNEKRYQEAVVYYERSISKKEDEWRTKHFLNLSWCYLKVHEFEKAIKSIKAAFALSKNPSYVDISDQVLDNIGSFYVYAGRPLEGMEFYLKNVKDPVSYLLSMAYKASDKGHEKETEAILASAQRVSEKNKTYKYQEDIFHAYLDYYRTYNRFADHERVTRSVVAYYKKAATQKNLKSERRDDAVEKLRSIAGYLQVKLSKDVKQDSSNFKKEELDLVLNFFAHLIALDPNKKAEYLYFRAETYYSVQRFKDAAQHYVETVREARKIKNAEHARKALNSLLALTGMEVLEKSDNKKYLIYTYTEHLSWWPKDEKSEQIYPKLFEIYHEVKDDKKATEVLALYNKHYPQHLKAQQDLMTKILDQFIEAKATAKLAHWIEEFQGGFLKFPRKTIEKTEIILGNILFVQYQDMAKKGSRLEAAKGFEKIYTNKLYSDKVKYQSALFAAQAYLELGETVKSYNWQALAYARMTEEEKFARREDHLKMTERTYKLQDFVTAYKISDFILNKYCSKKDNTQSRFYEIGIMTALVEEKTKDAEYIVERYSKCINKPELKDNALAQIYHFHEKKADFFGLRSFVQRHKVEPYTGFFRHTLQKWFWEKSDPNLKSQINSELVGMKHPQTIAWLNEMSLMKAAQTDAKEFMAAAVWSKPKFDGEVFNKSLEEYLLKLQTLKQKYHGLTEATQLDLAITSTRLFSGVYMHVGLTISALRPAGMDDATYKDFKPAMSQLSGQFVQVSRQYDVSLDKALKEKETLAWGSRSIASVEEVENPVFSFFTGLTMDKGREK